MRFVKRPPVMAGRSKAWGRFGKGTKEKVHCQKPVKTLIYSTGNAQSMNLSIQILAPREKTIYKARALINSGASGTFIHERTIKKKIGSKLNHWEKDHLILSMPMEQHMTKESWRKYT
jgi:hypothetical protein